MQSEINIKVGNKSPQTYFSEITTQIENGEKLISGIESKDELMANLKTNEIPSYILNATIDDYFQFLEDRRLLVTEKIKNYYASL